MEGELYQYFERHLIFLFSRSKMNTETDTDLAKTNLNGI